jgi:hypothetical protein
VDIILHVRTCEGFVRNPDGTIVKKWSKEEEMYPMQVRARGGGSSTGAAACKRAASPLGSTGSAPSCRHPSCRLLAPYPAP